MLAQNHAAGAYHAGNDDDQTKPPDGVEAQIIGKGKECAGHSANGCRMGGNLPPYVDECAEDLYGQCCHDDGTHEVRHVQLFHDVDAGEVADDGEDVWYHTLLAVSQFNEVPALIAAVEVDEQRGQEDGEQVDQYQHLDFVRPGKHVQVAEQEEQGDADNGQVERREQHAQQSGGQDNLLLLFHYFCLFSAGEPPNTLFFLAGEPPNTILFSEAGDGNAHLFAILGHRTSGDGVAFLCQQLSQRVVAEGLALVLVFDELTQGRLDFTCRQLFS